MNTSSRFLLRERAKDKTASSFVEVLNKIEQEISEIKKIMKTLLLDNGSEFSDIEGIEKSSKNEKEKRVPDILHIRIHRVKEDVMRTKIEM